MMGKRGEYPGATPSWEGGGRALVARDVAYAYGKNAPVLKRVSADIVPGSFLAILGVNGSGKSTLMSCLDGMLSPERGTITIGESELSALARDERAQAIALVAQHSHANRLTVYDALLLGRKPYVKTAPRSEDFDVVDEVIAQMGLAPLALRYVDELSGGEYQKVIIARAFVQRPDVLLLDEPTNNLDLANQAEVMRLVRRAVRDRGLAAAAVLHDVNVALRYCDRFLMVKDGVVAAYGGSEIVTPQTVLDVYGVRTDIIEYRGMRVMVPQPEEEDA